MSISIPQVYRFVLQCCSIGHVGKLHKIHQAGLFRRQCSRRQERQISNSDKLICRCCSKLGTTNSFPCVLQLLKRVWDEFNGLTLVPVCGRTRCVRSLRLWECMSKVAVLVLDTVGTLSRHRPLLASKIIVTTLPRVDSCILNYNSRRYIRILVCTVIAAQVLGVT